MRPTCEQSTTKTLGRSPSLSGMVLLQKSGGVAEKADQLEGKLCGIDVVSLNSIAPSSQPVDFGELIQDPLPALPCFTVQEEGLDPTPTGRRMWEDQEAEDVRMHSIIEAEKSKATWKSFCSRGFEESSEWRASPPNRALHDLHDLNLHEFLEDTSPCIFRSLMA